MKTFTIENETNNITIHATVEGAEAVANAERFRNEAGLAKLAANWPTSRLVEIWNSLPGATPVKKFKNRATAVSRIWKVIQNLGEAVPATATQQPSPVPAIDTVPAVEAAPEPEAATAAPIAPQTPDVAPEPVTRCSLYSAFRFAM